MDGIAHLLSYCHEHGLAFLGVSYLIGPRSQSRAITAALMLSQFFGGLGYLVIRNLRDTQTKQEMEHATSGLQIAQRRMLAALAASYAALLLLAGAIWYGVNQWSVG